MNIEFTLNPKATDIDFLTDQINLETSEKGAAYPFAFFIKNGKDQIIGGCNGFIMFGSIYTDQLWVDKNYRGKGYARQLMEKVHAFGRKSNCKLATLGTFSFQGAQAFYEKLGYEVDFKRSGYVDDSSCIFLRKNL